MNKKELIEAVCERENITKKDAEKAINAAFDIMTEKLASGEKVLITGFGTFKTIQRNERRVVSPMNNQEIVVPASRTISFKPSVVVKKDFNGD